MSFPHFTWEHVENKEGSMTVSRIQEVVKINIWTQVGLSLNLRSLEAYD